MAVSPLGNIIYVNQNMQAGTQLQGNHQARFDLQAFAGLEEFDEKQKELKEVRPTERSHEVDPDAEHEKKHADQEEEEREKLANHQEESHTDDEQPKPRLNMHILDIKV